MIASKFICLKEIYSKDDYRVVVCKPLDNSIKVDRRYGSFTISGSNIDFMKESKVYTCLLTEVKDGKYANTYKLVSRDVNADIKQSQVDLIEAAGEYGYKEDEVDTLLLWYNDKPTMVNAIAENPYDVYMGKLRWGFVKADKLICAKWPQWIDSYDRCERLVANTLARDAEMNGNTRMSGSELFRQCATHPCVKHLLSVCQQSKMLWYDADSKMVSLYRYWSAEQIIANAVKMRLDTEPCDWDIEQYRSVSGFTCTDEQMQALTNARDYRVSILCGCAGTGKSQTTKSLIAMLEDNGQTYALLAPTGIAAKRLRSATGRQAQTIHRWLCGNGDPLDYIVIDEFSMVGVELLANVLTDMRVSEDTRLVFICDNAQLASISAGNVIQDMLDSHIVPTAVLTRVFRYDTSGLAALATDVRRGDYDRVVSDTADDWDDLGCLPLEDDVVKQVVGEYGVLLNSGLTTDDILVLTPMKIGQRGSWVINNAIQSSIGSGQPTGFGYTLGIGQNAVKVEFCVGDKVINVKNNYKAHAYHQSAIADDGIVVNGDIGYVLGVDDDDELGKLLVVRFDNGNVIAYTKRNIRQLQLGYALTCHKTQGQQAPYVLFLADGSAGRLLSRNLLYVAVTRAQKHLTIIGDCDTLCSSLDRVENKSRLTNLKEMLT